MDTVDLCSFEYFSDCCILLSIQLFLPAWSVSYSQGLLLGRRLWLWLKPRGHPLHIFNHDPAHHWGIKIWRTSPREYLTWPGFGCLPFRIMQPAARRAVEIHYSAPRHISRKPSHSCSPSSMHGCSKPRLVSDSWSPCCHQQESWPITREMITKGKQGYVILQGKPKVRRPLPLYTVLTEPWRAWSCMCTYGPSCMVWIRDRTDVC